jgi:hypothetical protein
MGWLTGETIAASLIPEAEPEEVLKGVEKYDDEHIEKYITLTRNRVKSLEQFALITALVAGATVAELSSFDPKAWRSEKRSYVYVALLMFSVSVSTYCSVVVVMTLAAASRLQVTDSRLKGHSVPELYEEYNRPGTLLNHIRTTQPGWSVFVERPSRGTKHINFPVSLQWISEKYEELRPFIQLFPISTAAFLLGLLLRVLEKVEDRVMKGALTLVVTPMLFLTFLHSRRANEITFFQIGLKHESHDTVRAGSMWTDPTLVLGESRALPSTTQHERTPLLEESRTLRLP